MGSRGWRTPHSPALMEGAGSDVPSAGTQMKKKKHQVSWDHDPTSFSG